MLTFSQCDLKGKRVLIREDFNVPLKEDGHIEHDARILASLPTLKEALKQGASVLVLSHLGRPKAGTFDKSLSLAPVAKRLSELLNCPVPLIDDWNIQLKPGEIALFENVRFLVGEETNNDALAQRFASLCDIFVMDAFACAHRAHASTVGVIHYAPLACAGPLLEKELNALSQAFEQPARPLVSIIGGAKVSTKLSVLAGVLKKSDTLIVGGGMANTFLKAQGYEVGCSLVESEFIARAKALLEDAHQQGKQILLPEDVVVSNTLSNDAVTGLKKVEDNDITPEEGIYDVGHKASQSYKAVLESAKTIIWNGPVGVFELAPFQEGTRSLANAIAQSSAFSMAGGGDTLAALDTFKVSQDISYISTGGGVFLECLEGKELPVVTALREKQL